MLLLAVVLFLAVGCAEAPVVRADACATELATATYCSDHCPTNERCVSSGGCDEARPLREALDDGPVEAVAGPAEAGSASRAGAARVGAGSPLPGVPCGGDHGEVGFGPGSADLAPCAQVVRAMAATLLDAAHRGAVFEVVGGWDVNETAALGRARAHAVREALLEAGVPAARLVSVEASRGPPRVRLVLAPAARVE